MVYEIHYYINDRSTRETIITSLDGSLSSVQAKCLTEKYAHWHTEKIAIYKDKIIQCIREFSKPIDVYFDMPLATALATSEWIYPQQINPKTHNPFIEIK